MRSHPKCLFAFPASSSGQAGSGTAVLYGLIVFRFALCERKTKNDIIGRLLEFP
jgi:hypothetical protein